ncbi:1,2-epoxyphenylacetyl-CoA isomerase [Mycobacterium basiliense]|uniref:1,2-epoxyphenylacetyl-CoA isomerase n=1 Tax=Mycobacterium basiliense TaxID=2094119 RepID=A0A3S4DVH7_9MYCO|nr:enoyl-CoA hydratase [Mycobacterium basiliense]VDM90172.1 1,2-epoxyphenylacetyl-CoA isomerase [Mycobacterium basiliense]
MLSYGTDPQNTVAGLTVAFADGVLSLTLDRPDSLNSLTTPILIGIADTLETVADNKNVRLVRLRGAGHAFTSGVAISVDDFWGTGAATEVVEAARRVVRTIATTPCPVVAVVRGPAVGVGVSLALACDLVLAAEDAFFMLAHTKIGLMPDGGASALIAAAIGRMRAMRMALLPERLPAADALAWGLISAVYQAEDFEAEVDKVISRLLAGPPLAFNKTKVAINAATLTELDSAFMRESHGQKVLLQSNDFAEGAAAFHQRRTPAFTGS